MLVLDDAAPDRAAAGAVRASFTSAGQLRVAIECPDACGEVAAGGH